MTAPLESVSRLIGGEGSSGRRFRDITARLLAGEVVRMPEEPTQRLSSDWAFLDRHIDAFRAYVGVAGFRVLVDDDYKFAILVHDQPKLRETLDKATSRVAVACRLLYHQGQQAVRLTAGVPVTMRKLLEYLDVSGGVGTRTPRVKTLEGLRTLAWYEMVVLPPRFAGLDDDVFTITPVLPRRLPLTTIQDYLDRTRPGRSRASEEETLDFQETSADDATDPANESREGAPAKAAAPDAAKGDAPV